MRNLAAALALALPLAAGSGCSTLPHPADTVVEWSFFGGALLGAPATIAALPVTLPLGLALGVGHCGGPGTFVIAAPSIVTGAATAVVVGGPVILGTGAWIGARNAIRREEKDEADDE